MEPQLKDGAICSPQILEYGCYRNFLKDMYLYKKSQRSGFSYRRFASLVGLKSPNYLQLVIQGKRNLTPETGERIAKVLKLGSKEMAYFLSLIKYNEAKNEKEREEATRLKRIARKNLSTRVVPEAQKEVLSKWYHLLVRELITLKDFEPSGEYIASSLCGLISAEEGEASLKFLIQSDFVRVDEDGRYVLNEPVLSTGANVFFHSELQKLHKQVLKAWASNLDKLHPENQELNYLNIPINSKKIPEFRKRIQDFQDEMIGWLSQEDDPDSLVQLGVYLMPFVINREEEGN